MSEQDGHHAEEADRPAQERPPQPKRKAPDVDQPGGGEGKNPDGG